jgi:hypothetical protein
MKNFQFSNYAAQQQNVLGTLKDVITEGEKQGFRLTKPKGAPSIVAASKAGNPQLIFLDKDENRVYMRISTNLDAALTAGEKVDLLDSPVYEVELTQVERPANTPAPKMLVVGMKAEAAELEIVDTKKLGDYFKSYAKPEPAKS